ncbi:WD40 repeat-like protein [Hesseltinella vesiculosa]|uniref:WD40 repeat-like protein n=1 Tax=Hesseltinella vesiculosa TaxID=101127 RepID=A0A1X2GRF7_9FUNG|nr:WD40 repeat-like protein [Hesseltinella vesiculosa]
MHHLRTSFGLLSSSQKQDFLTELINACDHSMLTMIHCLVGPKLKVDYFRRLPLELSLHILSFIDDPYTLFQCSRVSFVWRSILMDESLWKRLCLTYQYDQKPSSLPPAQFYSPDLSSLLPPSYQSHFRRCYQIDRAWVLGKAHLTTCPNDIGNALVTSLQMDEEFIVVGCDNNHIEVFDATSGAHLRTLRGHSGGVWALQFIKTKSQCLLVSGGCDRDARVWDLRSGKLLHVLQGHTSTIRCLKLKDETTAVTGSRDATLRIWDLSTGRLNRVCIGHQSSVRCLDIRGDVVVSGSYDGTARLWQISTGECLLTCLGQQSQIYAVVLDDHRIITASLDSTIKVWSIDQGGTCLATLHGHTMLVGHLQLVGETLISGGSDGCLRFWDLNRYECKNRISAHDSSVTCLQVDGHHVLSGGSDGTVKLWDLQSGQLVRSFTQSGRTVWKVECLPTKAVVVIQRRSHLDRDGPFQTAIELHDFAPSSS